MQLQVQLYNCGITGGFSSPILTITLDGSPPPIVTPVEGVKKLNNIFLWALLWHLGLECFAAQRPYKSTKVLPCPI